MSIRDMSKEDLIDELVGETVHNIRENMNYSDVELLENYLRCGFKGFNNMTTSELRQEYLAVFGEEEEV